MKKLVLLWSALFVSIQGAPQPTSQIPEIKDVQAQNIEINNRAESHLGKTR